MTNDITTGGLAEAGEPTGVLEEIVEEALGYDHVPDKGGPILGYIAAALPAVVGVFGFIGSSQLVMGTLNNPGPGFWPRVLSVALIVISVAIALTSRRTNDTEAFTRGVRYVGLGALSLLTYGLMINTLGFELPTAITGVVWLKLIGKESWKATILATIGAIAAVYLVFIVALSVSIPHWLPI